MALPPNMVVPGLDLDNTEGLPDVEVDVPSPVDFTGGAEVIDDGQGGAIVQAMSEMEDQGVEVEIIDHDANLAEFLDDGVLGEISSELVGLYEEDYDSRRS